MNKYFWVIIFWILGGGLIYAQTDESYSGDIEILEELFEEMMDHELGQRRTVSGNYFSGYGLTFHISNSSFYFNEGGTWAIGNVLGRQDDRSSEKLSAEELAEEMRTLIIDFLADVAPLATFLADDESILVKFGEPQGHFGNYVVIARNNVESRPYIHILNIEASYSDIMSHSRGQLSRDDFESRLIIKEGQQVEEVETDLNLFGTALRRSFRDDLSKSFTVIAGQTVQRIENLGVLYNMQFHDPRPYRIMRSDAVLYQLEKTQQSTSLPKIQSSNEKQLDSLYQIFEQEIKDFVLKYGRVIKSLDADEQIIIRGNLPSCINCSFPKRMELSVEYGVLQQFYEGRINEQACRDAMVIKLFDNNNRW